MARRGPTFADVRTFHFRVPTAKYSELRALAAMRDVPLSKLVLGLIDEALAPRPPVRNSVDELAVHQLIAIEQVIALIESFLPRGQGAAGRLLERATEAARARLTPDIPEGQQQV
jgi:hypothetical protein